MCLVDNIGPKAEDRAVAVNARTYRTTCTDMWICACHVVALCHVLPCRDPKPPPISCCDLPDAVPLQDFETHRSLLSSVHAPQLATHLCSKVLSTVDKKRPKGQNRKICGLDMHQLMPMVEVCQGQQSQWSHNAFKLRSPQSMSAREPLGCGRFWPN